MIRKISDRPNVQTLTLEELKREEEYWSDQCARRSSLTQIETRRHRAVLKRISAIAYACMVDRLDQADQAFASLEEALGQMTQEERDDYLDRIEMQLALWRLKFGTPAKRRRSSKPTRKT